MPRTDDASEVQPKGKAKDMKQIIQKLRNPTEKSWLQKAKLTKQAYACAVTQASFIRAQIDSDEKWAWARHHEIQSALNDARNTVANVIMSNSVFLGIMCTADLNAAKKDANDENQFEAEMKTFSETLDQHVNDLQRECKSLMEQHAVRVKYAK